MAGNWLNNQRPDYNDIDNVCPGDAKDEHMYQFEINPIYTLHRKS